MRARCRRARAIERAPMLSALANFGLLIRRNPRSVALAVAPEEGPRAPPRRAAIRLEEARSLARLSCDCMPRLFPWVRVERSSARRPRFVSLDHVMAGLSDDVS